MQCKWRETDERTLRAWATEIDATEAGAYGVSLAAIEMTGYSFKSVTILRVVTICVLPCLRTARTPALSPVTK